MYTYIKGMVLNCFSLNCCTPYGCRFLTQKMYTLCTPYVHLHKRNGIFGSFLKRCTFFVHLMYTLMYTLCTPTYNMIYIKRNIIRKIYKYIFLHFHFFSFWILVSDSKLYGIFTNACKFVFIVLLAS